VRAVKFRQQCGTRTCVLKHIRFIAKRVRHAKKMKQTAIIITLGLLVTLKSYCQENSIWTQDRICTQIQNAIVHVTTQPATKNFKIKSKEQLTYGWGYNFVSSDYVAGKLHVEKEKLEGQDKEKVSALFKTLHESESGTNKSSFNLNCCGQLTSEPHEFNTIISKLDDDTMLFYLMKKSKGKNGPRALIYLFFFDKYDKIEKVTKTNWVE
jgi:hypothetical protein